MGAVRQLVNRLRELGCTVHEWPGWDGRGNEGIGQIDPVGAVLHHTATGYGSAFEALASGRPDLRGVLCNLSGNADGSFTVVASGLAWHAGAGAGPSLGPLASVRGWMNRWTVGLEIVYPGDQPMTNAQRHSALIFAYVVAELFADGDLEYVRAHAETNGRGGDGKWDPGYAPGKTIDMAAFRAEAETILEVHEDMALTPNDGNVQWAAANPYVTAGTPGSVETHPVAGWVGLAAFHALEAVRIGRLNLAATAALANDPDITPAEMEAMIRRSDAEHAPIVAAQVAASLGGQLGVLVREALDKVQENDSEQDVAVLLRRIASLVPAPV